MKKKVIALVGRPNVGKSTLFNRLSNKTKAIVHPKPGVTRDRKYAEASIGPFDFLIIDTPGLEEAEDNKLEYRMMQQTISAIKESDLVCLMIDGKNNISPTDKFFANFVRQYTDNYILIVNKCEKQFSIDNEIYKLGFGTPVAISAEHALGMMDLYEAIQEKLVDNETEYQQKLDPLKSETLQIVVSGRPNAGKSTFINGLIGDQRMLTGPEAGITRESVTIDWRYKDTDIKLVDTAGLRKRNVIQENLEKLSASDAIGSINFANTVILIIDAQNPLELQDLKIASYVIEQGRGLVIAINKCDLISNLDELKEEIRYKLDKNLSQVKGVPIIFMSAINNQNISSVLDECISTYKLWNIKIPTSKLNNWLSQAIEKHPLPLLGHGRRLRIKYITQIKNRPPTFKLFANNPEQITDSYKKYLVNDLREYCRLPGIAIRMVFSKTANPYGK